MDVFYTLRTDKEINMEEFKNFYNEKNKTALFELFLKPFEQNIECLLQKNCIDKK